MSKERLEEIKKHRNEADNSTDEYEFEKINFYNLHVDWLIEQAERVQELEEKNKRIRQMKYYEAYEQGKFDTNMKVWYEVPKLEQENKRYREALEFYADEDNYRVTWDDDYEPILHDGGEKARKALEGEE